MVKIHLLFVLYLISVTCYSQSKIDKLDSLKLLVSDIEEELKPFQKQLNILKEEIRIIEIQIEQTDKQNFSTDGITTLTNNDVSLRKNPEPIGEVIIEIPPNETVTVYEINVGYYYVKYNEILGWAYGSNFKKKPELDKMNPMLNFQKQGDSSFKNTNSNNSSMKTYTPNYSYRKTWVDGHYRTVNGKKVWVKGHYRKN